MYHKKNNIQTALSTASSKLSGDSFVYECCAIR